MSNNSKTTKQNVESINDYDFFEGMSNESRELFKRILSDVMESEVRKFKEECENVEMPPPSKRYKIGMNRVFREHVGGSYLPFPEEDNLYERVRSKIVVKFKINKFIDRCKERRRERKW